MKQYTQYSVKKSFYGNSVSTTTTKKWLDYKDEEKFDCELELIGKMKEAMNHEKYKMLMNSLVTTADRPIKYDGELTVQFNLSGPERQKVANVDKSVRDVRNLLLYDVTTDRVYGFALPSDHELDSFQQAKNILTDSFLGRNRWFFGTMLYGLSCCCFGVGPLVFHCCIYPEMIEKTKNLPDDLDVTLLQEDCFQGSVYLEVFTHDYTRYGSHDSSSHVVVSPATPVVATVNVDISTSSVDVIRPATTTAGTNRVAPEPVQLVQPVEPS